MLCMFDFWPFRKKIRVFKEFWVIGPVDVDEIKCSDRRLPYTNAYSVQKNSGTMVCFVRNVAKIEGNKLIGGYRLVI